jgi:hypothetical protein
MKSGMIKMRVALSSGPKPFTIHSSLFPRIFLVYPKSREEKSRSGLYLRKLFSDL